MTASLSPAPQPPDLRPRRPPRLTSLRTIVALMLREMGTTYGRSPGGYAWAVLEPVAAIALLSLVFSLAFRHPPIGQNFPLFYATGMVPFLMFNDLSNKVATALLFSRQLLAYPRVTYIDAILARFLLNALTHLMVAYIVFSGILLIYDPRVILDLPAIADGFVMAGALAIGVGTMNCYLYTRFPVWQRAWAIVTRPLMIVSCVIFIFDSIPQPYRGWLWWNPLVHVVGQTRSGFYPSYDAPYVSGLYVFAFAGIFFLAGLVLLHRSYRLLLQN
jgi:capsular polysaccharide transport system permease protein